MCGMPEATYVLDFMGPISMGHLILSHIHFWGCINGSCGKQLQLAVILIQLGIYAIKVAKLLCIYCNCVFNPILQNFLCDVTALLQLMSRTVVMSVSVH